MITKSIKHIAFALAAGCGFAVAVAGCTDWDDHYEGTTESGSQLTLWQQMQDNVQISDFCTLLQETKVFRMHKKTAVSYADLLNGGQSFTVIAPVNGTFDLDSLLDIIKTNQGDSVVEKSFVLNHIARSPISLKSVKQNVLMLNNKYVEMEGNLIQDINVVESNCHAVNGVLHVVEKPLPYPYNLYEALCDLPEVSSIGAFLRQYEWDEFDPNSSVTSGIIEGVPVYVDSVVIEHNRMLDNIGLLNDEDSTYWVVAPTTAGWQKAWSDVSKYFVFDSSLAKRDSLQQYFTNRALLDDAVFNMTDQKSVSDSLVSVPYLSWRRSYVSGKPIFHVFKNPFEAGGILYGAEAMKCSNGVLYKTDEWPFTPEETFFKELWTEGESEWLIIDEKSCTTDPRSEVADSISNNAYLRILPEKVTSSWEVTFRLLNTLSGTYDICAIVLPKSVSGNTDKKPCKFKAVINYVDETGAPATDNFSGTQFITNAEKVDTVVLAEAFRFPACNYNQINDKISLTLQCQFPSRENSKYSREMYLDCIYLRPRVTSEE